MNLLLLLSVGLAFAAPIDPAGVASSNFVLGSADVLMLGVAFKALFIAGGLSTVTGAVRYAVVAARTPVAKPAVQPSWGPVGASPSASPGLS